MRNKVLTDLLLIRTGSQGVYVTSCSKKTRKVYYERQIYLQICRTRTYLISSQTVTVSVITDFDLTT
jgi:hypothetical protein